MRKIFFWAIAIISGLTILGSNIVNHTAVQGVQQTVTPTIAATATPVATATPTVIPTATPTPKPVYVAPTSTPTPIPQIQSQGNNGSNNDYYINKDGDKVKSPAYYDSPPSDASAICGDGTYSSSRNRRGTCSHHGGVAQWL